MITIATKVVEVTSRFARAQSTVAPTESTPFNLLPPCTLQLQPGQVIAVNSHSPKKQHQTSSEEWLKHFWHFSLAQEVCADSQLGENGLRFWADLCGSFDKSIFLNLPTHSTLPQKRSPIGWRIKCWMDRFAAATLLLVLSPLLLVLMALVAVTSPGPVFFRQWRVGEGGKLFQILKFRTMSVDAEQRHHQVMGAREGLHKREDDPRITCVGQWMRKYSLDELPQLINVLRGEMSLVGPRPWALYDALRIEPAGRMRLNALPGITGAWQVSARSTLTDLGAVNDLDLNYLHHWSLREDFKLLLLTIPKVFSGFGAC